MGTHDLLAREVAVADLQASTRILVAASPGWLEPLSHRSAAELLPGLKLLPLLHGLALAEGALDEATLAVIEVDPEDRASIARISAVRQRHPTLTLIAAIQGADISLVRTLVREGFSDVVALPFDLDELLQATLDAAARRGTAPVATDKLAPLVAVARSIGGCGATTIATHLAAEMAAHGAGGRGAVIVDLDLQFGSVADYLGVSSRGSIADLLGAHGRLDEDLVHSVTATGEGGVSVISAPDTIMPLEAVDTDELLGVIGLLRRQFGYVVLDLPANWTNWTLSAALAADIVILVVELSVASLRQAKRRLELFRSVGLDDEHIRIVANRIERRLFRTIDLSDVARTLGHPVLASVALEAPGVSAAQDQGLLVGDAHPKSRFARDLAQLGAILRTAAPARDS